VTSKFASVGMRKRLVAEDRSKVDVSEVEVDVRSREISEKWQR